MATEETAQDESGKTDENALSSLAAALEAKDDVDDKGGSDEETGKEREEKEKTAEEGDKTSEDGEKGKEGEHAEDGEKTGEKEGEEQLSEGAAEVAELRSLLRSQKIEMSLLKAKQGRIDKRTSKVIDEEPGEETDIDEELTSLETKIAARNELSAQRGAGLEVLLEQMSDTKRWGDVKEVVTESRVEGLVDLIAEEITREQGGEIDENRVDIELSVWSQPNPYKYLYNLIKKYHSDYIKKEEKKETETDTTEKKKDKEPVKANASIGDIKGGSDKGGWTADKIDKMDELDLGTVPKDVYQKYLRGELD